MLTLISTPIGNLKDITLRALESLQSVDGIICEDSRRASILLNSYQIKKMLIVLNDFNEVRVIPQIIEKLKFGQNLALVSDAGTPLISDPGYKLVKECLLEGIKVDGIPGPSAVTDALVLSGQPPDKFLFLGFLPEKVGHRKTLYKKIKNISQIIHLTYILFVSPYKLVTTLQELNEEYGSFEITLAKELTKIHQSVETNKSSFWIDYFSKTKPKGEYVLLFHL